MLIEDTIRELKIIMMSLTVKYKHKGESIDTVETKFNANRYISAVDKTDNFHSHSIYDPEAIKRSGLTLDNLAAIDYASDPQSIPHNYRKIVLEEQRKIIINEFVEYNPYFRMLNGQPPLSGDDLYASIPFYESFGIELKPVSEMTDTEILHLESSGELDIMKNNNPGAKYLNYLGPYKIDPYTSRKAYHFQVLRTNYTKDITLLDKFLSIYEENRSYLMSVLYVKDFSKTKPYYDEFMALMLSVMTTQRVIVDTFKSGISRDFYDVSMIRALYDSYNVPFVEELPLVYHNLICKNLNKLLHYKSTDKVIFDLLDLLGFGTANVFKYYLVKNHRMDVHGNPIFEYKEDENGNLVEDKQRMYDVHFVSVNIDEENEEFELRDSKNRLSYQEVTSTDPYWWDEDSAVLEKIYEEEYNYINTKYMHINVMYKLTDMIFEVVHALKILKDKKSQTDNIEIAIPKIINSRKVSLFDFFVIMAASLCRMHGLKGEIVKDPSMVAGIVGFNFNQDFNKLREYLNANSHLIQSNVIMRYISNLEVVRLEDVDRIFSNVKNLWEFVSKQLSVTKDYEAYTIYEQLYRILFVSENVTDVFTKRDGTIAETYMDMLMDIDPEIHALIEYSEPEVLRDYISHGIETLENMYTTAKSIHLILGNNTSLMDALLKLMRFFKSYTVDIRRFNVVYVFDHPYLHGIKLLDRLKQVEVASNAPPIDLNLLDYITFISEMSDDDLITYKDMVSSYGMMELHNHIIESDLISVKANIDIGTVFRLKSLTNLHLTFNAETNMDILDSINRILHTLTLGTRIDVVSSHLLLSNSILDDGVTLDHLVDDVLADLSTNDKFNIKLILKAISKIEFEDELSYVDKVEYFMSIFKHTEVTMYDLLFNETVIRDLNMSSVSVSLLREYVKLVLKEEVFDEYMSQTVQMKNGETVSIGTIIREMMYAFNTRSFISITEAKEIVSNIKAEDDIYGEGYSSDTNSHFDDAFELVSKVIDLAELILKDGTELHEVISDVQAESIPSDEITWRQSIFHPASNSNIVDNYELKNGLFKSFFKLFCELEKVEIVDNTSLKSTLIPDYTVSLNERFKGWSSDSLTFFRNSFIDQVIHNASVNQSDIIEMKDALIIVRESEEETY